jgi:hypothetical protein
MMSECSCTWTSALAKISVEERRFAGQSYSATAGLFFTQLRAGFQDGTMMDN